MLARGGFVRHLAVALVPALLLLGVLAAPVGAAKPTPSAAASLAGRGCSFAVSYNWSKFSGRHLVATIGVYAQTASGESPIQTAAFPDQLGKSGSVSSFFTLTADVYPAGGTLVARGQLVDAKSQKRVAGSDVVSEPQLSPCG
jgi:hypothetical protein